MLITCSVLTSTALSAGNHRRSSEFKGEVEEEGIHSRVVLAKGRNFTKVVVV